MAKIIPVVRLEGAIATGPRTLNIARVGKALEAAFAVKAAPAVALVVNSPGGSAVQSSLIGQRIRQLSEIHKKPAIAFVEDVAASGGYWIAAAADEILVDPCSIVGSIGVIGATFGLDKAIERLGVDRRVYTAGRSKSQLDPFKPENPEDVARVQKMLEALHATFIAHVKARRGAKLKPEPGMFEGEVFVGAAGVAAGLADGVGELNATMRERYGKSVKLKRIPLSKPSFLQGLLGGAGAALVEGASEALEAKLLRARYGL